MFTSNKQKNCFVEIGLNRIKNGFGEKDKKPIGLGQGF